MSPIIRECQKQGLNYFILHTGQHYSYGLDKIFFQELELPQAKYNLNVGSGQHGEQTGKMLTGIEKVLLQEKPDIVLVEGDTDSVLAAALAAAKLHIKVGHVEAGLRSYDRNMPEEINRVLADHISDYLFAPTEKGRENLLKEGIPSDKVFVTGNTIVDAVYQALEIANRKSETLSELGLENEGYIIATIHREENVDIRQRLKAILDALELVYAEFCLPIIFPIHPRTRKRMQEFGLEAPKGVKVINPLSLLKFLQLESGAKAILTDSGGVQEEACILHVPCITLRDNTERPETIEVGANILAGCEPDRTLKFVKLMVNRGQDWPNPFGSGTAGREIMQITVGGIKR